MGPRNPEVETELLRGIEMATAYHGQFRESQMILNKAEERFQNMAERVKGSSLANGNRIIGLSGSARTFDCWRWSADLDGVQMERSCMALR